MKIGVRFHPSDPELLMILRLFITGEYNEEDGVVKQRNVYGEDEPWEFCPNNKTSYFFTPLQRIAKNGKRFVRSVGRNVGPDGKRSGTWHGQDREKPIVQEHRLLGFKRSFVYKNRNEPEHNGEWLMKEYFLPDNVIKNGKKIVEERKDFVICRLKRKPRSSSDVEKNNNFAWDPRMSPAATEDAILGFIDRALGIGGETTLTGGTYTEKVPDLIVDDDRSALLAPPPVGLVIEQDDNDMFIEDYSQGVEEESTLLDPLPVGPVVGHDDDDMLINDYFKDCFEGVEVESMLAPPPPPPLAVGQKENFGYYLHDFSSPGDNELCAANPNQPQQQQHFSLSDQHISTSLQQSSEIINEDYAAADDQQWLSNFVDNNLDDFIVPDVFPNGGFEWQGDQND